MKRKRKWSDAFDLPPPISSIREVRCSSRAKGDLTLTDEIQLSNESRLVAIDEDPEPSWREENETGKNERSVARTNFGSSSHTGAHL